MKNGVPEDRFAFVRYDPKGRTACFLKEDSAVRVLTGMIRFISGVLLFLALALAVVLALLRTQKSDLPQIGGYYLKMVPEGSVSEGIQEKALFLLKRNSSYTTGDVIAYLNDEGDVSLGKIRSIGGKTEGASAEVPYGLLENGAGSPTFGGGSSAMADDPLVETAEDSFPADRILAKEVYSSACLGFLVSIFSEPISGFAVLAVLALLAFMPWRRDTD
jgi:hypothetical protein